MYPTSLSCYSSWHTENLQGVGCRFEKCDLATTTTIYNSVDSFKVLKACFFHVWGHLSWNSSGTIPEQTPSWCSILWTIGTYTLIDCGGFPLQQVVHLSWSSQESAAPDSIHIQRPSISIWIYIHYIVCCFLFLVHLVQRTILKCVSWFIFSIIPWTVLQCTN